MSFDRLVGITKERLERDANGAVFVFFGKQSDRVKIVFRDRTGICPFYKRLDRGLFPGPQPDHEAGAAVSIDEGELEAMFSGIDLRSSERKVNIH
jgi:transposase